jgi:hypothetical protein
MKELQTTGVPDKFVCEFAALVDNSSSMEKDLHEFLSEYRTSSNREFFDMDPTLAKFLIEIRVRRRLTEVTSEVNNPVRRETSPPRNVVPLFCNTEKIPVNSGLGPDLGVPPGHLSFSELLARYNVCKQTLYNRMNAIDMKKSLIHSNKSYYSLGQVLIMDQVERLLRQGIPLSKVHTVLFEQNETSKTT